MLQFVRPVNKIGKGRLGRTLRGHCGTEGADLPPTLILRLTQALFILGDFCEPREQVADQR